MKNEIVSNICENVIKNRLKILDDFFKAYLCSFDEKYFLSLKKDDFKRIIMVEKSYFKDNAHITEYQFKLKKGVIKNKNIKKL